jgi:hypothetical protein
MSLCPFFKETCKGNQCMMWENESCLVAAYLKNFESLDESEDIAGHSIFVSERQPAIPEYFKLISADDLAKDYLEFLKTELPDSDDRHSFYEMFDPFLHSKGLEVRFNLPTNIALKIDKARILADNAIKKEHQQKVTEEKSELPNLVDLCVDWSRANGLKTLRKSDLETFLMEKEYEITEETKRALYSIANTKLKSR